MREVKLDAKPDKSDGALVGSEGPGNAEALISANGAKLSEIAGKDGFARGHERLVSALKQVFLFLPGAFLLFFMSYGVAIIAVEFAVYRRPLGTLTDDYPFQFALMGSIILLGTFMTWFGLGDIRNRRHFIIPASLMVAGSISGAIVKAAASVSGLADRMLDDFGYLIYLLPLALVIPVLAKGVVDRRTEDAQGRSR